MEIKELKTVDAIMKRRSIRRYSGQPVPDEPIRQMKYTLMRSGNPEYATQKF